MRRSSERGRAEAAASVGPRRGSGKQGRAEAAARHGSCRSRRCRRSSLLGGAARRGGEADGEQRDEAIEAARPRGKGADARGVEAGEDGESDGRGDGGLEALEAG